MPQTGDGGYRQDTVIVSCMWYRGIQSPLLPIVRTGDPYYNTIYP